MTKFSVRSREMWCQMKEPRMGSTLTYVPFGVLSLAPQIAAYHAKLVHEELVVLIVLLHHAIHVTETEAEVVEVLDSSAISRIEFVSLLEPWNSLSIDIVDLSVLSLVLIV